MIVDQAEIQVHGGADARNAAGIRILPEFHIIEE
jgi:hypothetical protein